VDLRVSVVDPGLVADRGERDALDPHSARTGGRSMGTDWDHLPHPHLLDHVFQMTEFTWEHLGLREDLGYRDAQKAPSSPNAPEHGHHKTLVPHGTHSDLAGRRMTAHDHHDRHLARGCLTATGAACGQPR
jgi:hypothetical protein